MSSYVRKKFLRMMDPKYNYSRKRAPKKIAGVIIAGFVWLFAAVWFNSQAVKFNYEINELGEKAEKLKMHNRTLELKLQTMMSREKIADVAKERYGFTAPGDRQVYIIKKEKDFFERIAGWIKSRFSRAKRI